GLGGGARALRSAGARALVRADRVDRGLRSHLRLPGRRVRPCARSSLGAGALRSGRGPGRGSREPRADGGGARWIGRDAGPGTALLGRLAGDRRAARLRALAGAGRRPLARRHGLLQRQRLHRPDRARLRRHRTPPLTSAQAPAPFVRRLPLLAADALTLPFADGAFACVVSAFLLRNLEDLGRGLGEMRRVTRPGGRVVTLDIVEPSAPMWSTLFGLYFNRVVPAIG